MSQLTDRSLKILRKLVEHYIEDGQPVGSKTLAQDSSIQVSSATIRNIMSELEAAGYLQSPYTSAGRIPTAQGYRLFVDNLITVQAPQTFNTEQLREQLGNDINAQTLVANTSSLLSNITQLAGIVTVPKRGQFILKLVEFLPLSERRVLVVLVFNEHEVQNRVINTDRHYSVNELEQAGNYLTQHFAGKDLVTARHELLTMMQSTRKHLDEMIQMVMSLAEDTLIDDQKEDYVLAGETNLFSAMNEDDYKKLRDLFEAFAQKRDILHLLDQAVSAKGMQIYIGEESGYKAFDDCSLIAAPYTKQGNVVGVLGVIGPTRMEYNKVISAVDITAKLLSQALDLEG